MYTAAMEDYIEASLWTRIAFYLYILGFTPALFVWVPTAAGYTDRELTGSVHYRSAVGLIYWDEIKGKIAHIFVVVTLLAGISPGYDGPNYFQLWNYQINPSSSHYSDTTMIPDLAIALWVSSISEIVAWISVVIKIFNVMTFDTIRTC